MSVSRLLSTGVWLLAILGMVSCKPRVPSQYIQPDELEDLLCDYHTAQAMALLEDITNEGRGYRDSIRDYNRTLYFAAVLKKHGVTKEQFDSSMLYYYTRADRLEPIYKRVAKRLEDEAVKYGASEGELNRYATVSEGGDTVNVWEGNRNAMLLPYPPYNRLDFVQTVDSTYKAGDNLIFSFMGKFQYQAGTHEAIVSLTVKLDNDSVISRVSHITVDGRCQVRVNLPDNHMLKQVSGFVLLTKSNDNATTLKLMFLNNLQLICIHKQSEEKTEKPAGLDSARIERRILKPIDSIHGAVPDSMLKPVKLEN